MLGAVGKGIGFPFLIGYGQVWPDIPKMAVK